MPLTEATHTSESRKLQSRALVRSKSQRDFNREREQTPKSKEAWVCPKNGKTSIKLESTQSAVTLNKCQSYRKPARSQALVTGDRPTSPTFKAS